MNTDISDLESNFVTSTFNVDNETITAGYSSSIDINCALSNYNIVGVLSWNVENATSGGTGASYIAVYGTRVAYPSTNYVRVYTRNYGSSDAKILIRLKILFSKKSI